MSLKDYSTTAGSNATLPGGITFAENQNPSTVNDSMRLVCADLAEFYADIVGGVHAGGTVGGTNDAITLTLTPALSAYASGQQFLLKAGGANTSTTPTLNVSGLGTKTIKLPGGVAVAASQWAANDMLLFVYNGTDMMLVSRGDTTATIARNAQTGTTYTVLSTDRGKHVTHSNASSIAVTLPQATSAFGAGWYYYAENIGAGTATITPTTSTINTGSALVLRTNEFALITSDGTNYRALTTGTVTGAPNVREVGTRGVPVTTQDGTYGFVLGDAGSSVRHSSASTHTWTIPANASVAFPVGTAITLINEPGGGNVTIAITTDTLNRGDGTAGTGSRTLAANSIATVIKTASTTWMITGAFS